MSIVAVARKSKEYVNALDEQTGKRNAFYDRLKAARREMDNDVNFIGWLKFTYGIKLHLDSAGMITEEFSVVDKHKYLIFLLKFVS